MHCAGGSLFSSLALCAVWCRLTYSGEFPDRCAGAFHLSADGIPVLWADAGVCRAELGRDRPTTVRRAKSFLSHHRAHSPQFYTEALAALDSTEGVVTLTRGGFALAVWTELQTACEIGLNED